MSRGLAVVAGILGASLVVTACHDVSTTWDAWYYHLPFAARLGGVVPASVFRFHSTNQARLEGFPLLAELLQGLLWRITGRAESANLVALAALGLFVAHLRQTFKVPWHLGALGLLAVPLVQLHATSAYVDLFGNLAATAFLLGVGRLYFRGLGAEKPSLAFLLATAAAALNSRFQLHPIVGLGMLVAAPRALGPLVKGRDVRRLGAVSASLPFVFFSPLKNLIVHKNPYYPMRLSILGVELPGPEATYSHSPPYLASAPRPVRWVYSLLEIGIRPMRETRRWTIDQWMPSDSTGNRMGGFFGGYVVFNVALLVFLAVKRPAARRPALGFLGLSLVASMLPQSHELRYYLFWMITLVALNLALVAGSGGEEAKRERGGAWLGLACTAALGVVLWVTEAGYAYPSGSTFRELVSSKVSAGTMGEIGAGDRVCVEREPWSFLYSSTFHPEKGAYAVREVEPGDREPGVAPKGCGDYRWLP